MLMKTKMILLRMNDEQDITRWSDDNVDEDQARIKVQRKTMMSRRWDKRVRGSRATQSTASWSKQVQNSATAAPAPTEN